MCVSGGRGVRETEYVCEGVCVGSPREACLLLQTVGAIFDRTL